MDAIWLSVLSAVGGVVITLIGGLLGAWLQGRREHERWLREKRLSAYIEFLSVMDIMATIDETKSSKLVTTEFLHRMATGLASLKILGPLDVYMAADAIVKARKDGTSKFVRDGKLTFSFLREAEKAVALTGIGVSRAIIPK